MKTKINFKKTILSILSLVMMSVLVGCEKEISIIVNKKLDATVKLKNLEKATIYYQEVEVDLSLATDDVDKIATAVIKSFELTLNDDYVNAATNNEISGLFFAYFVVGNSDLDSEGKATHDPQKDVLIVTNSLGGNGNVIFKVGESNKYILPIPVTLKDYIIDKKVKLFVGLQAGISFGDNDFSLGLKVEAELQVDL